VVTVRPATFEDAPDIVHINVRGWQRAYAGIVPDDVLAAMDATDRIGGYRRRMAEPGFEHRVAVDLDRVVGYVVLGPYRPGPHDRDRDPTVGEILAIYVEPTRWGTGAGRALMSAALRRLAARGFALARLWVLAANHQARRFYEQAGFAPDGMTAAYPVARPDGSVLDLPELRYARRLP
jgi:ribosomal protein S18 acetylase RimI-like enzyme